LVLHQARQTLREFIKLTSLYTKVRPHVHLSLNKHGRPKLKRTEPTTKYFPLVRKTQRIEPTTKHYTTLLHWPENSKGPNPLPSTTPPLPTGQKTQKDRTHDQALHHPSPLARKLKRTEPTTKHYTTPSHWSEKLKESNPRPCTTPPFSTGQKTQNDQTHDPGQKTQKDQTHYQALHHPSPLARKLKRIEPTKKHYTTTAEKPFEVACKPTSEFTQERNLIKLPCGCALNIQLYRLKKGMDMMESHPSIKQFYLVG
jgi:hypothetical protein